MLRILIVTPYYMSKNPGGTERYVSILVQHLSKIRDVDVSILTTKECVP